MKTFVKIIYTDLNFHGRMIFFQNFCANIVNHLLYRLLSQIDNK